MATYVPINMELNPPGGKSYRMLTVCGGEIITS